ASSLWPSHHPLSVAFVRTHRFLDLHRVLPIRLHRAVFVVHFEYHPTRVIRRGTQPIPLPCAHRHDRHAREIRWHRDLTQFRSVHHITPLSVAISRRTPRFAAAWTP